MSQIERTILSTGPAKTLFPSEKNMFDALIFWSLRFGGADVLYAI